LTFNLSDYKNNFESLTIKKIGERYSLYGLMWYEFTENNKKKKALVSVKSNNLKWKYNFSIEQNCDYTYYKNGNGSIIGKFLSSMTRNILYQFAFTNIMSDDVLVTLTILNDGKDGFMKYNIYEELNNYTVKINVAGVKKEDIRVVLENGIIKVKTNPKEEVNNDIETKIEMFKPVKGETEIYLPNIESVDAELKDGILILTAPKVSKGVKIEIISW